MKALSLWQPHASLVSLSAKRIETRSWQTSHRGWLAIHAAKRWSYDQELLCYQPTMSAVLLHAGHLEREASGGLVWATPLPVGGIVAVARLDWIGTTAQTALTGNGRGLCAWVVGPSGHVHRVEGDEVAFGDYSEGRFGWVLSEIHRLATSVPCRGHQSLFDLPADVEAAVRAQLPAGLAGEVGV